MYHQPIIVQPTLLLLPTTGGARYFLVRDTPHLYRTAYEIVRERAAEGWYPDAEDKVNDILSANDSPNLPFAYDFLESRCDFEYENIELIHLEKVP